MPINQYKYGRGKEQKVARSLRSKGAKVEVSKGSRVAADLIAIFPSGTKWNVQVKAARSGGAAIPSSIGKWRLKQVSTRLRSTAVVAKVSAQGVLYKSAVSGRTLSPPKFKKR